MKKSIHKIIGEFHKKYGYSNFNWLISLSLSDFVRMSLSIASNSFMYNIFPNSRVMNRLMSKKAKKEFIAFRKKYMNISTEFSS